MLPGEIRELARRQDSATTVVLCWRAEDDAVFVILSDRAEHRAVRLRIAPASALDAFWHPYIYHHRLSEPRQAPPLHRAEVCS